MKSKQPAYAGMYTAANNQYHGIKSMEENGAIAHTCALAHAMLKHKIANTELEAITYAQYEVKRLCLNIDGLQLNRIAREELNSDYCSNTCSSIHAELKA